MIVDDEDRPVSVTVAPLCITGQAARPLRVPDTASLVGLLHHFGDGPPLPPLQVLVTIHLLGTASLSDHHWTTWRHRAKLVIHSNILPFLKCSL